RPTTTPKRAGREPADPRSASSVSATSTTGGARRARAGRAVPIASCTTSKDPALAAASRKIRLIAIAVDSSSGTWCSCNTTRTKTACARCCPKRTSIRAWVSNGQRLNINRPFLGDLVDAVVERMGQHYPELVTNAARIKGVLASEEELFSRTLKAGTAQLERLIAEGTQISGRQVFDLYQTYGFPVELTEEILRAAGMSFDPAEFDAALAQERERARGATQFTERPPNTDSDFVH